MPATLGSQPVISASANAIENQPKIPRRFALIIANNSSLDENVQPLKYADDDAAKLFELLGAIGYDTRLLVAMDAETANTHQRAAAASRAPTRKSLDRVVGQLKADIEKAQRAGEEVDLIITYSGHGAVGRRGDPYINLLDQRLYRGDFFRSVVAQTGADFIHVIIDACRARDFVDARGGPDGPDFNRELSLFLSQERRAQHPEVGIFVAESADRKTHEWSKTRSGIFAHEVISGLSGAADVNGDGKIEYSELHAFVASANSRISDARARLRVVAQAPSLNPRRPLIELNRAGQAGKIQTPAGGGRYSIEDERGVRWVDAHLEEGNSVRLHLPLRQRFYVINVTDGREAVVSGKLPGALVSLSDTSFSPVEISHRGSISASLASDLFAVAYGAAFYKGFAAAMRYTSVDLDEANPGKAAPVMDDTPDVNPAANALNDTAAESATQEHSTASTSDEGSPADYPFAAGDRSLRSEPLLEPVPSNTTLPPGALASPSNKEDAKKLSSPLHRRAGWVAVVSGIAGAVLGMIAIGKHSDLMELTDERALNGTFDLDAYVHEEASLNRYSTTADIMFTTSLVAAATWLLTEEDE